MRDTDYRYTVKCKTGKIRKMTEVKKTKITDKNNPRIHDYKRACSFHTRSQTKREKKQFMCFLLRYVPTKNLHPWNFRWVLRNDDEVLIVLSKFY